MFYYMSILIVTFGFLCLFVSDVLQIKNHRIVTTLFTIFGFLGVLSSIILLIIAVGPMQSYAPGFSAVMWGLSGIFLGALVYTVFFAVRRKTGSETTCGKRRVVMHGLYGIVRHPGFYWFLLLLVSLSLICRKPAFFIAAAYMAFLDFLLILIEDRLLFPRLFADYSVYKTKVPFIIPGAGKKNERM